VKAAIFDMDNTVVLSEKYHIEATQAVLQEYDIDLDIDFFYQHYLGRGSTYVFRDLFKKHQIKDQLLQAKSNKSKLYKEIITSKPLDLVEGFLSFFKELKKRKVKTILASGSSIETIQITLKQAGIEDLFPEFTSADNLKKPKPAPDVFLEAAKKIKVNPSECIAFEDAYSGIDSAKSAAMTTIGIATSLDKDELLKAGADHAANNYKELLESLDNWFALKSL